MREPQARLASSEIHPNAQNNHGGAIMGEVIRKQAAVKDIVSDAKDTLVEARSRGGIWKDLAEARLASPLALYDSVQEQRKQSELAVKPLAAAVRAKNDEADDTIKRHYDEVWNEVGRPQNDAALTVIFPEGGSTYTDGSTEEQPDRMEVLMQLIAAGIHPKLSKVTAERIVKELEVEKNDLEAKVDALRKPAARLRILERVETSLGRVLHTELTRLKKAYKAEGFSEADIHQVIPDRPTKAAKAEEPGKTDEAPKKARKKK